MKLRVLLGALALSSCVTAKPFTAPDGRAGFAVKCNGTARSMGDCYQKAAEACGGPYEVMSGDQRGGVAGSFANGGGVLLPTVTRELLVSCKAAK